MKRLVPFVVLTALLLLAVAGPAAADQAQGARASALAGISRASAVDPVVRVDDQTGSVEWISGRWAAPAPGRPVESSYRFLEAHRAAFGIVSPRAEFRTLAVLADDQLAGWKDVYLGQLVNGVPVLYATLAFHYDAQGRLQGVNGDYVPTPSEIQTPRLTAGQAAGKAVEASGSLPAPDATLDLSAASTGDPIALAEPATARLVYFRNVVGDLRLSYEVTLTGTGPEAWKVVVDARNGAILSRISQVETAGSGIDLSGKRVSLSTSKIAGVWKLVDRSQYMFRHHSKHPYTTFEGSIEVRDAQHIVDRNGEGVPKTNSPVIKDANGDNFFNHGGSDPKKNQRSAVSLARNLSTTYKVFRSRLGRNSVDGKGLSVIGNVHLGVRYENAYWHSGTKMMYFGDNASGKTPFAKSLDVVAHEFGHGVSRFTVPGGGFVYAYPSGALSEAFSDIWGTTVDPNDWQMGEDLGEVERDLANPGLTGLPSSMLEYQLMVTPLDNGGNHVNCTIGGHFYQQLAQALPATAPAPDGRFTAAKIIYRSYRYVTNQESYREWALALSQAAVDLYSEGSPQVTATRNTLVSLGIVSYDFDQNDNGWCLDQDDNVIEFPITPSAGICYFASKFTTPQGAQLRRAYVALDPDSTFLPNGKFHVYVVGVNADGSPDIVNNPYDYEQMTTGDINPELGMFTAIDMTADDFVTPRVVPVPAQYFILVGFQANETESSFLPVLQDDGSSTSDLGLNWVISFNPFNGAWTSETLTQWTGSTNPLNFMIRPMYWYNLGTNSPPPSAATKRVSPVGAAKADSAASVLPSFAPVAAD